MYQELRCGIIQKPLTMLVLVDTAYSFDTPKPKLLCRRLTKGKVMHPGEFHQPIYHTPTPPVVVQFFRRLALTPVTTFYIIATIVLLCAWGISTAIRSQQNAVNQVTSAQHAPTSIQLEPETSKEDMPMSKQPNSTTSNDTQSNTSISAESDNAGSTVTVNGQTVDVPADGSYQQTYDTSSDGLTSHIDVSVNNSTSGNASSNQNSRSMHVNVQSHNSSSTTHD